MKKFTRFWVSLLLCLALATSFCFGLSRETAANEPAFGDGCSNLYTLIVDGKLAVEQGVAKIPSGDGWYLDMDEYHQVRLVLDGYNGGMINGITSTKGSLTIIVKGENTIRNPGGIGIDLRPAAEDPVLDLTIDLAGGNLAITDVDNGIVVGASTCKSASVGVICWGQRHYLTIDADSFGIYTEAKYDKTTVGFAESCAVAINAKSLGIITSRVNIGNGVALAVRTSGGSAINASTVNVEKALTRYGKSDGSGNYYIVFPKDFYQDWKASFAFTKGSLNLNQGDKVTGSFGFSGDKWARTAGLSLATEAYNCNSSITYPQSELIPCAGGNFSYQFNDEGSICMLLVEYIQLNGKTIFTASDLMYFTVTAKKSTSLKQVDLTIGSVEVGKALPKASGGSNVTVSTAWSPTGTTAAAHKNYSAEITVTCKEGYVFTDSTKVTLNGKSATFTRQSDTKITVYFQQATAHNVSSAWTYDENSHWKACSGCSEKFNLASHTIKTEYTNNGNSLKKTCTVCGWSTTITGSQSSVDKLFLTFPLPVAGEARWWAPSVSEKGYDTSKFKQTDGLVSGAIERIDGDINIFNDDYWTYKIKLETTDGRFFKSGFSKDDIVFVNFDKSLVVQSESVYVSGDKMSVTYTVTIHPVSNWTLGISAKKVTPGKTKMSEATPDVKSMTSSIVVQTMDYEALTEVYKDGKVVYLAATTHGTTYTTGDASSVFEEGSLYTVNYNFVVSASYLMDGYKIVDSANAAIKGTAENTKGSFSIVYDFRTIDKVSLTDLEIPEAGNAPNNKANAAADTYLLSYGAWETTDTVFKCDTAYTYVATITTTGERNFAAEKNLTVTINGKKATILSRSADQIDVSVSYNSGSHKFGDWTTETAASCDIPGTRTRECVSCGYSESDSIPSMGHILVYLEGTAATCIETGSKDRYICQTCGLLTASESEKPTLSDETAFILPIDPDNHVGGEMTYDRSDHWIACACGAELDREAHSFGEDKICTVCGYKKGTNPNKKGDDTTDEPTGGFIGTLKTLITLWWFWVIIAVLLIAVLVLLILLLKKKKDDKKPAPDAVTEPVATEVVATEAEKAEEKLEENPGENPEENPATTE